MASHSIENGLHIAKLRVVDAKRSMEGDTDEAATLLEACRHDGFFHLDIRTTGPEISLCVERMYELEEKLYSLPYEEKMLYDIDNLSELKLNGYKPVGRNFGGIGGQSDGFETYASPYFPRATSEETLYTSGEWIQRKFSMLRGASSRPNQATVLTGGHLSATV